MLRYPRFFAPCFAGIACGYKLTATSSDAWRRQLNEIRTASIPSIRIRKSVALMALVLTHLVTLPACARVESIDQYGNKKTGWFLASSSGFVDGETARAVSVSGFGLHRVGPTWGLGLQKTRYVKLDQNCRVVVIKEYAEQPDLERSLGLNLNDICRDREAASAWAAKVRTDGS